MPTESSGLDLDAQVHQRTAEISRLLDALAARTFTGHDTDNYIEVSGDGTGRPSRVDVSDWAWDNLDPTTLGRHLMVALNEARRLAMTALRESARGTLGLDLDESTLATLYAGLTIADHSGRDLAAVGSAADGIVAVRVSRRGVRAIRIDSSLARGLAPENLASVLATAEANAWRRLGRDVAARSGVGPANSGIRPASGGDRR